VANGASDEEISSAIAADKSLSSDLALALKGALVEQAPGNPAEIVASIGAVIGLVGQNWSRIGRGEFSDLALNEFMALPGALVLDALARARRRVTDGRFLVSWVCDDVEPKAAKLKLEIETLTRLVTLALPAD
jgi:hypothetical protein